MFLSFVRAAQSALTSQKQLVNKIYYEQNLNTHILRYCSLTHQIQNTFYSLSHKLTEMKDNDWLTIQWHVVDAVNVELGNDGLKAN